MDLNFELFEEGEVGRSRDRVHVTLGKDYHIYFSRKAVEALGGCEGVALMFDRRRQVIGVMPADVERNHSYRLRKSKISGAGRRINAKNFCRHFGLQPAETVAFYDAKVNRDGVLVLDLNAAAAVKAVSRQRS